MKLSDFLLIASIILFLVAFGLPIYQFISIHTIRLDLIGEEAELRARINDWASIVEDCNTPEGDIARTNLRVALNELSKGNLANSRAFMEKAEASVDSCVFIRGPSEYTIRLIQIVINVVLGLTAIVLRWRNK